MTLTPEDAAVLLRFALDEMHRQRDRATRAEENRGAGLDLHARTLRNASFRLLQAADVLGRGRNRELARACRQEGETLKRLAAEAKK